MTDIRNALITGASGGIGAASARLLAADGARVWITYSSDAAGAQRVAEECEELGAHDVVVSSLDLDSAQDIEALAASVAKRWSELHVVVNNGGTCPYTDLMSIDLVEWNSVMGVNVRGTFWMIRTLLPLLRASTGDRSVVNVASLAGQVGGLSTSVHYATSKGAVLALTRSLARRLAAEGIRVNAVAPGPVDTRLTSALDPDDRTAMAATVPLGRFGHPEEVAHAIHLLATGRSGFTTGATYDVNGGLLMD